MKRMMLALSVAFASLVSPAGSEVASASGTQCGSLQKMCTEVIGQGTYVNRVRSSATTTGGGPCDGVVYHFEFWAGNWRHSTPDQVVNGDCLRGRPQVTSEWVTVERDFPDRTVVCGRLWQREGAGYRAPFREECVTLRR